jgi:hypothetical protein
MRRTLLTLVALSGVTYAVFIVQGGTVAEQTAYLVDAGAQVSHSATCPVRLSDWGLAQGRLAYGAGLKRNVRIKFPAWVRLQADGGVDVQLPPMDQQVAGNAFEVVSWADCTLSNAPADIASVTALLGQALPVTPVAVVPTWVRPRFDAGLPCLRRGADGGGFSFGDLNVFPRAEAVNDTTCEFVGSGVIMAGDSPEFDL